MKKLFFIVAVFFLAGTLNAQEFVKFGAKAGVNFASLGGDEMEDFEDFGSLEGRTGFHLGLVAEIPLGERFSFQPEVLYSSQGAKMEGSETFEGMTFSYSAKINLDYINVPLLAKYYVTPNLNIHAGPQIGFLVKSEAESELSFGGDSESDTEDLEDITKGMDFALAAGLGYKLEMGLFFDARYNLGLSNVWDNEGQDIDDFSQKNNVFQVSVGFMF